MENQQGPPDGYLELESAAKLANVSTKTVRNWARARRIGQRRWPGTTKVVYSVNDIKNELAKSAEMTIVRNPAGPPVIASMGAAIANARGRNHEPRASALNHRDIVSLHEAARLKGYSERYFVLLNSEGRLPFYRVPGKRGRYIKCSELDVALVKHRLELSPSSRNLVGATLS